MNGKLEVISSNETIGGMVAGSAQVRPGAYLRLSGMICGDLVVDKGGSATVSGTVCGTVRNSGHVVVHGSIDGIETASDAVTEISEGAHIKGKPQAGRKLAKNAAPVG